MKVTYLTRSFVDQNSRQPAHEYRFDNGKRLAFEVPREVHDEPGMDWWWEAQENMKAIMEVVQYDIANSLISPNPRIRQAAELIVKNNKEISEKAE